MEGVKNLVDPSPVRLKLCFDYTFPYQTRKNIVNRSETLETFHISKTLFAIQPILPIFNIEVTAVGTYLHK